MLFVHVNRMTGKRCACMCGNGRFESGHDVVGSSSITLSVYIIVASITMSLEQDLLLTPWTTTPCRGSRGLEAGEFVKLVIGGAAGSYRSNASNACDDLHHSSFVVD